MTINHLTLRCAVLVASGVFTHVLATKPAPYATPSGKATGRDGRFLCLNYSF